MHEKARYLAILVVTVWKVRLGTEQCVAPRMPGIWCSGSLKADFLSQSLGGIFVCIAGVAECLRKKSLYISKVPHGRLIMEES